MACARHTDFESPRWITRCEAEHAYCRLHWTCRSRGAAVVASHRPDARGRSGTDLSPASVVMERGKSTLLAECEEARAALDTVPAWGGGVASRRTAHRLERAESGATRGPVSRGAFRDIELQSGRYHLAGDELETGPRHFARSPDPEAVALHDSRARNPQYPRRRGARVPRRTSGLLGARFRIWGNRRDCALGRRGSGYRPCRRRVACEDLSEGHAARRPGARRRTRPAGPGVGTDPRRRRRGGRRGPRPRGHHEQATGPEPGPGVGPAPRRPAGATSVPAARTCEDRCPAVQSLDVLSSA